MPLTLVSITQLNKVKLCTTLTFQFLRIAPVFKFNVLISPTIRLINLQSQGFHATNFSKHNTIKQGQTLHKSYFPIFISMFCCTLLYVHFSIAIILMGRESWLLCLICLPGVS